MNLITIFLILLSFPSLSQENKPKAPEPKKEEKKLEEIIEKNKEEIPPKIDPYYFVANEKLPTEIKLLAESIHWEKLSPDDLLTVSNLLKELDHNFSFLSQQQIYLIAKSEIYKAILRKNKTERVDINLVSRDMSEKIESRLEAAIEGEVNYSPFAKWMMLALSTDLRRITISPYLNDYFLRKKKRNKLTSTTLLSIDKKLSFLIIWYMKFRSMDVKTFNNEVFDLIKYIMKHINLSSTVQIQYSLDDESIESWKLGPEGKHRFFTRTPRGKKKKILEDQLEDVVKEVIKEAEEDKKKLADEKAEDWKPKEEKLSGLPEDYPTPDPNYKPPRKLPKPVNDWVFDI